MEDQTARGDRHSLLDEKLTELALYAKQLCPGAAIEVSSVRYEDEDGHVAVSPPRR